MIMCFVFFKERHLTPKFYCQSLTKPVSASDSAIQTLLPNESKRLYKNKPHPFFPALRQRKGGDAWSCSSHCVTLKKKPKGFQKSSLRALITLS